MTEDELRDALAAEAEQVSPAPDAWRRVVEGAAVAGRGRRRRMWLQSGIAATGLALAVALVALLVVRDDDGGVPQRVRTADPPSPTSSSTTPTSTFAEVRPPAPVTVIGYSKTGRIVELESVTGKETRTIATAKYTGRPGTGHVSISWSDDHVYYDADDGVWQAPRRGGSRPTRIGDGRLPMVSLDGKTLAYARSTFGDELVLRDVATGRERVLKRKDEAVPQTFLWMAWDANSRVLSVNWEWEGNEGTMALDTTTAKTLDDGTDVTYPDTPEKGDTFRLLSQNGLVAHTCCVTDAPEDGGQLGFDLQWSRVAVLGDKTLLRDQLDVGKHQVTSLDAGFFGAAYVLDGDELWVTDMISTTRRVGSGFVGVTVPFGPSP